jgi:hypothetical protein
VSRLLGAKRENVRGGLRELLNEKLHKLCTSPHNSIIRVIKSRTMRVARHERDKKST